MKKKIYGATFYQKEAKLYKLGTFEIHNLKEMKAKDIKKVKNYYVESNGHIFSVTDKIKPGYFLVTMVEKVNSRARFSKKIKKADKNKLVEEGYLGSTYTIKKLKDFIIRNESKFA